MIKVFAALFLTVSIFSCNNGSSDKAENTPTENSLNTLSEKDKADGWQLLFDGKTTIGWHKYGNLPVGAAWKINDGALHLEASEKADWQIKSGGDIVSEEEFENFHLKLEWKIDTCGNSGVMFYVHEDSTKYKYPWMTGLEMQVLDNKCHADAKIIKHRAGDLYDIISSSEETVKPALEWNAAEIKCLNGALEFYLNGKKIVGTTLWNDAWKNSLLTTKWKEHKDFGTYKKGHIALQDHGNNVWYRNIMIKKL